MFPMGVVLIQGLYQAYLCEPSAIPTVSISDISPLSVGYTDVVSIRYTHRRCQEYIVRGIKYIDAAKKITAPCAPVGRERRGGAEASIWAWYTRVSLSLALSCFCGIDDGASC